MKYFNYNNKTMNLTDWCRELNINYSKTRSRIKKGMPFEEAILEQPMGKLLTYNGVTNNITFWGEKFNISTELACSRMRNHPDWTFEQIFFTPKRVKNVKDKTDVGSVYGNLIVTRFSHRDKNHYDFWLCYCKSCDNKKIIMGQNLRAGLSKSCGCQAGDSRGERKSILYEYNGKKLNLRQWAEELGIRYGTLRTRRNNGLRGEALFCMPKSLGGYPKIFLTYNDKTQSIPAWAKELDISVETIRFRHRSNKPIDKILYKGSLHEARP